MLTKKRLLFICLIFSFIIPLMFFGCSSAERNGNDSTKEAESTVMAGDKNENSDTKADAERPKNNFHTQDLIGADGKRVTNFFGIHTMIYPEDDMKQHMDWAEHLIGKGGFVKERFEPITRNTKGPASQWIAFLMECYERDLIPVVKIGGAFEGHRWAGPEATGPNDYSELAAAVKRVFEQLPLKKGVPIYVEVFNEPNLRFEWGGNMPNPREYGHLLVQVADALRSIGDPRIRVMNGALSPGGDYHHLKFLETMLKTVPESLWAFDVWASHPYPYNHPPEYNIHDGTAVYREHTIDSYMQELKIIERFGRKDTKVILTETGYELGNEFYTEKLSPSENFPAITEELRADYTVRAYRDYWSKWPEIIAVCPFEMAAVQPRNWVNFDWIHLDSESDDRGYPTKPRPHYDAVAALPKPPYVPEPALQNTEDRNMELAVDSGNIAIGAKATSSTSMENWGWSLSKINNGFTTDSDLGWTSSGEQEVEWVTFDFSSEKEFGKVILVPRSDGQDTGKYFPQSFDIQISNDGKEWSTVYTHKNNKGEVFNPGAEPQTHTFKKTKARYFRILITEKTNHGDGGYHVQLSELEIY